MAGGEEQLHLLTSVLDTSDWSNSSPGRFTHPGKTTEGSVGENRLLPLPTFRAFFSSSVLSSSHLFFYNTKHKHLCPRRDSNLQSHHLGGPLSTSQFTTTHFNLKSILDKQDTWCAKETKLYPRSWTGYPLIQQQ